MAPLKAVYTLLDSVRQSAGLVSASIYDTAQVLRFQPDLVNRDEVVTWLLSQQEADGGWGTPALPVARLVPTLACLLAIRESPRTKETIHAIEAAQHFLSNLSASWPDDIPNDMPVGMELLLPVLLDEICQSDEKPFDSRPFQPILEIGQHRHTKLTQISLAPGSPPLHSYESLALPAEARFLDGQGSLSHSPAATAAWLQRVNKSGSSIVPDEVREQAQSYLSRCIMGTPTPTSGVYPGVWPMDRFEQCFVLYFFAIAGAFTLPAYRPRLIVCASDLASAMRPTGIGLSDHFAVDGDDTAAAIIALISADLPVYQSWLDHFRAGSYYYAYAGERHGSLSLIARAMHAAMLMGNSEVETAAYLRSQQQPDGRWANDKWHASWIYPTMHAVIALVVYGDYESVTKAGSALCAAQRPDGSWGTAEETAYALLSLTYAQRICVSPQQLQAMYAGRDWLRQATAKLAHNPPLWIGKELYTLPRVVQSAILASLIAVHVLVDEDE
ncbi:MAG: hypothetical protein HGA19_05850 [Oscillochloris sp.]|nr:hypothetical protein [Oscillochloris sp.]